MLAGDHVLDVKTIIGFVILPQPTVFAAMAGADRNPSAFGGVHLRFAPCFSIRLAFA